MNQIIYLIHYLLKSNVIYLVRNSVLVLKVDYFTSLNWFYGIILCKMFCVIVNNKLLYASVINLSKYLKDYLFCVKYVA